MKKLTTILGALFVVGFVLSSCDSGNNNSEQGHDDHSKTKMEMNDNQSKENNKVQAKNKVDESMEPSYACPMHPEITGKKGDNCSKCGMDLELEKKDDHDGHNH